MCQHQRDVSEDHPYYPISCSLKAVICDLFDVVCINVQEPLDIDLDLSPQGEPVEPFVGANIPKDRLNNGHALGVDPCGLLHSGSFSTMSFVRLTPSGPMGS